MANLAKCVTLFICCIGIVACSGGTSAISASPTAPPPSIDPPAAVSPTTVAPPTSSPQPTLMPTTTPCAATAGQVEQMSLSSSLTGGEVRYRVYLPPCYGQYRVRYPVLYLLHGLGSGMDDSMWDAIGIDETASEAYLDGSLPPHIIVMPNGNDAQHDRDSGLYAQIIAEELIPTVEQTYCIWSTAETRAVGGLSRGGFWAYSVAFQYPELFTRVGGHSGFFYEGDFPENNPYNLAATAPNIEELEMYLDYGANDRIVEGLVEGFAEQLRTQRGIEPLFLLNPSGAHNSAYWAEQSPAYLAWYSQDWPTTIDDYPACEGT